MFPAGIAPSDNVHITTLSGNSMGVIGSITLASATWTSANVAIYVPFSISSPRLIRKLFWQNGTAVSGNVDCGIYDSAGTKIVSTGSTAQSGTSAIQSVDITDTMLGPGQYFLALAMDNTTATTIRASINSVRVKMYGIFQQATAFPLPATATFATNTGGYLPFFGATTILGSI